MNLPRAEVIVVGAGPVGMLAAIAAAKAGLSTTLLEKNRTRPRQSRAVGITPPTLGIFERLGIVDRFLANGAKVTRASGHSPARKLCDIDLSGLQTDYPFILTLPQDRTEALLESAVEAFPNVTFLKGMEVTGMEPAHGPREVVGVDKDAREFSAEGNFILGCDGGKSVVRVKMGSRFVGGPYPHTFLMADYRDMTGWGEEARLYFTDRGSVESFPLPGAMRRFVLRTPFFVKENSAAFFAREMPRRCGVSVERVNSEWESAFGVQHFLASPMAASNVFLCGDAAHLMSPIGGQNMNVGFADAELAVWLISAMKEGMVAAGASAAVYDRFRRKAARSACMRAELMMRLGTSGGAAWNGLRGVAMDALLRTPLVSIMNGMFSMLSLPNRDLPSCKSRLERALGL
jgi:2-polyprenyl-6-methoxyphenol hydroxylase-like FAD-dependent oxidoreductase